jgi:sugar-specific transcriptional regulator TrmB
LRNSGNTDRKTDILSALVRDGPSTALQVVEKTGIPLNKVYHLLKELRKEELVMCEPYLYKGTVYGIIKPHLLQWLKRENETRKRTSEFLRDMEKKASTLSSRLVYQLSPELSIGPAEDAISRTSEIIMEAKRSIKISTFVFSWYENVKEILINKVKRNVKVQVLMSIPSEIYPSSYEESAIEARRKELQEIGAEVFASKTFSPFRGFVVDERILLVMMFSFRRPTKAKVADRYFICSNKAVVNTYLDYFKDHAFFNKRHV